MTGTDPLIGRGSVTISDPLRRFHEFGKAYTIWVDESATSLADEVAQKDDATLARRMSELEGIFEMLDQRLLDQELALRREFEARQEAHLRAVEEFGVLGSQPETRSAEQIRAAFLRVVETFGRDREQDITAPLLDDVSEGLLDAQVLAAAYGEYKNELRGPPREFDEVFGEPSGGALTVTDDYEDYEDYEEEPAPVDRVVYMGDYLGTVNWEEEFAEWLAIAREQDMRVAEREPTERTQLTAGHGAMDANAVGTGVRQLGVWHEETGPLEAARSGAIERIVGRDDVSPPPALDELRHLIGSKRAEILATRMAPVEGLVMHAPDAWIRRRRAELGPPDAGLDRVAALETLRLEAAQDATREGLTQALEEASVCSEGDPERAAVAQRTATELQQQLDDVSASLAAQPENGKLIDNWIESGDDRLVRSLMYQDEAKLRWYADAGYLTEFSVVNPPAHVVAVIGDRPAETDGSKRETYDAVTRNIEMHRLLTESAQQAGFEPPVRSPQEEQALQRQIEHVCEIRGIETGRTTPGEPSQGPSVAGPGH